MAKVDFTKFGRKAVALHKLLPETMKEETTRFLGKIFNQYAKSVILTNAEEALEIKIVIQEGRSEYAEKDGGTIKFSVKVYESFDITANFKLITKLQMYIDAINKAEELGAFDTLLVAKDQEGNEYDLEDVICKLCVAQRVALAKELVESKKVTFGKTTYEIIE